MSNFYLWSIEWSRESDTEDLDSVWKGEKKKKVKKEKERPFGHLLHKREE